jgi:predicted nucleic acid-binding protein
MIGLDTTAIIDLSRGDPDLKELLSRNKEPKVSTIINYLEVFFGLNPDNSKHNSEAKYFQELFHELYMYNLTKGACELSSKIEWELKAKGKTVDTFDCVIAAILLSNGVRKIITRNEKHFAQIKQLQVMGY